MKSEELSHSAFNNSRLLLVLKLNRTKFSLAFGAIFLLMIYAFFEGLLPVLQTGNIEAIQMKQYQQIPFFIISVLIFIIFPPIFFVALWRNGTTYFYTDRLQLNRFIGGTYTLEYSSMHVQLYTPSALICNYLETKETNWVRKKWVENFRGVVVPLSLFLRNTKDAQKAISILKENARDFQDMRNIKL